jgi:hypothetical protein
VSEATNLQFDDGRRAGPERPGAKRYERSTMPMISYPRRLANLAAADPDHLAVTDEHGLVHDADTLLRPRLAWKVNGRALRIERYPTDSIKCRVTDPLAGEVD